jgi:hypothetical protein
VFQRNGLFTVMACLDPIILVFRGSLKLPEKLNAPFFSIKNLTHYNILFQAILQKANKKSSNSNWDFS